MAPLMVELKERGVLYNFIFTGQHRDTMSEILEDFNLKNPDSILYDGIDIVSIPQMIIWATKILFTGIRKQHVYFLGDNNGIVLVHGDTVSTILGALLGRVAGLKVAHVESGLRSFNLFHPFPEEILRLAIFRLSHVLLCPGLWAVKNVQKFKHKEIINTYANTMMDCVRIAKSKEGRQGHIPTVPFAIVSIHRYENIFKREKLQRIVDIVEDVALSIRLLFILHKPTRKQLIKFHLYQELDNNSSIELRPRYPYMEFLGLLERAEFIVADGGSLQEETSYLGIPCLLLREATERQEGLATNATLSGYNQDKIEAFIRDYKKMRIVNDSPAEIRPSKIIVDTIQPYATS
jgi:UDP-N-acetylglucosamine 2-epimerase (non-hydrolysing)